MEALTELAESELGIAGLGISSLLTVRQLISKCGRTMRQEPRNPIPWQFPMN